MTFIPASPVLERRLSSGSVWSGEEECELGMLGVRRVSDISHINQLRREISGLSHLARHGRSNIVC